MLAVNYSIWLAGFLLEIVLLTRAVRTKLLPLYPSFYLYISFVLIQSVLRLFIYNFCTDATYSVVYWTTEFLGAGIGCLVVFEIYRAGLSSYPGTARMARRALAILFVLAVTKALVVATQNSEWRAATTTFDVVRSVRTVQALAIAALIVLFLIYAVPFGRNLKGILFGYGSFIGVAVIGFTFAHNGHDVFSRMWAVLNPVSYGLALTLWVVYLWAPQAHPEATSLRMEEQYQQVAARTRRRLQQARGFLGKATNP
jgi:hypothetical protein